jgi:uncharacterized protein (TIGR03437 family)
MLRGLFLIFLVFANLAISGTVQTLPSLPTGATANAVQVDTAGNIYVAGGLVGNSPSDFSHAFVGKFSPDGSQIIWWTVLAGSKNDNALALALGADNSVYVTGTTFSSDFPATIGSMQSTTSVSGQAFAAKINQAGAVVYSTYIGGMATTTGNAIAVDPLGDAFITGSLGFSGVFPTTAGAVTGATSANYETAYVIELNPLGSKALVAISGFGGNAIALDAEGNIYGAGAFPGRQNNGPGNTFNAAPTTTGAFQTITYQTTCLGEGLLFELSSPACTYQHVAKIDPTGTQLIYATYVSGSLGATPTAIAVDANGNVILAGNTNSSDYPTTPAAYQPEYFANPEITSAPPFQPFNAVAPAPAGYITKLSASGSSLIWSTLFGGSHPDPKAGDVISGIGIDASGNILLSGTATSSDLPGLWSTPVALRPTESGEGFVGRLSSDGTTLSMTQLIAGSARVNGIAVRSDGSAVVVPTLAAVSLSSGGRVATISDTADAAKLVSVAPGQLLTLYGTALAPAVPAQPANSFPMSFNGVTVTFNGIAAPILYTSSIQINLQVPYEIAGQNQVTMQVSSQSVSPAVLESYVLAVVERQPSVFVAGPAFSQPLFDSAACNGQNISGLQPLAINADGSQNSCANPAASGSVITVFLNGLGVSNPSYATGMVSPSEITINPAAAINPPFGSYMEDLESSTNFLATATLLGSIDSIAQVHIKVSPTSSPSLPNYPTLSPVLNIPLQVQLQSESPFPVRGPGILIWVQASN